MTGEEFGALGGGLAAAVGAIAAVVKPVRAWYLARKERMGDDLCFKQEVREIIPKVQANSERLGKIEYALFNEGKTGVLNHVAELVAKDRVTSEEAHYPAFQCDGEGRNTRVSAAYRRLIGATRAEGLSGTRWQAAITGPLKNEYVKEFGRCSAAGEDFYGVVDFQNPSTGEPRGRWKIFASCQRVLDAKVYFGRFEEALDPIARRIATEEGWEVRVSSVMEAPNLAEVQQRIAAHLESIAADPSIQTVLYELTLSDGSRIAVPVAKQQWTAVLPGMDLKWLTSDREGSCFLIRTVGGVTLPPHWHEGRRELVEVTAGKITDTLNGRVFVDGDTWDIPPGEEHHATFHNARARIRIEPPAPPATAANIKLQPVAEVLRMV